MITVKRENNTGEIPKSRKYVWYELGNLVNEFVLTENNLLLSDEFLQAALYFLPVSSFTVKCWLFLCSTILATSAPIQLKFHLWRTEAQGQQCLKVLRLRQWLSQLNWDEIRHSKERSWRKSNLLKLFTAAFSGVKLLRTEAVEGTDWSFDRAWAVPAERQALNYEGGPTRTGKICFLSWYWANLGHLNSRTSFNRTVFACSKKSKINETLDMVCNIKPYMECNLKHEIDWSWRK